jgi:hypothetical protein
MDLTDVVHQFEIWNEGVQRAVFNSPEFKKIVNTDMIEYEIEEAKAKVAKKYAYLALDDKYKTEVSCIDNALTPHEWFKEKAISEEESTWNIKKSELPFEPEAKDTILPF